VSESLEENRSRLGLVELITSGQQFFDDLEGTRSTQVFINLRDNGKYDAEGRSSPKGMHGWTTSSRSSIRSSELG